MNHAFRLVERLRKRGLKIPVFLFSYLNPVLQFGASQLAGRMKHSGFDGLIVPDLTPDEGKSWEVLFRKQNLALVYLVAPTTRPRRMRQIASRSSGFVYYVSLKGVTGARSGIPPGLAQNLRTLKAYTKKPVLVGFGVSRSEQGRKIARVSDGIVVGSAIVDRLKSGTRSVPGVKRYVHELVRAINRTHGRR